MSWTTLSSKIILKNKFLTVKEDRCKKADGEIVDKYYTLHRPDVAVIAPLKKNPKTKQFDIVLVLQYRYTVNLTKYELPAGYIEPHEKHIKSAAKRELKEETGFTPKKLIHLNKTFASSGIMNNVIHHFVAFDCEKTHSQNLDPHEEITVKVIPFKKALKLIEKKQIKDMASVTCLLLAKEYLLKHNLL